MDSQRRNSTRWRCSGSGYLYRRCSATYTPGHEPPQPPANSNRAEEEEEVEEEAANEGAKFQSRSSRLRLLSALCEANRPGTV